MTALILSKDAHRRLEVAKVVENMGHDTIQIASASAELSYRQKTEISAVWMDGKDREYWIRFFKREIASNPSWVLITF